MVSNITYINSLPDEILLKIFKLLPIESLLNCENVCQHWWKLSHDPAIWRCNLIVHSGNSALNNADGNLAVIVSHGQYITNIKLRYIDEYSFIKDILDNCDNLISLELVMCNLDKEFVEYLKRWAKLKKLNLKNSMVYPRDIKELLLVDIKYFQELTYLDLTDFGISSINCNDLIGCAHLCHIYLDKIKTLTLTNVIDLIVAKQRTLQSLHIYGGHSVDDKCLILLSQCPNLRDLAIIRCDPLTDIGLLSLGNLKKINQLQLWNNIVFTELALIKTLGDTNLFSLNSLSLSKIYNMSPVIVDIISENYKNLKFLALYQCPKILNTSYDKQLKIKFRNIDVVLF